MCSITSCWKGFKLKNFLRFARKPVTKRQRAWMLKKLWMQFLAHTSASGWTTLFRTITGFSTPGPLQRLCFRTDACAGFTGSERFRRVKAGLQADKQKEIWLEKCELPRSHSQRCSDEHHGQTALVFATLIYKRTKTTFRLKH